MNSQSHHRRSIRLKEYDYTQAGAYFITICTYQRQNIFGEIVNGEMKLNSFGEIAYNEWFKAAELRLNVNLFKEQFVVMPNHVHGNIWLIYELGTRQHRVSTERFGKPVSGSIPTIIRAYKSAVTYAINKLENSRGAVVWQKNYYEHVIRNEKELELITKYIEYNPMSWQIDRDNAENINNLPAFEKVEDYIKDVEDMIGLIK
jgi:putative transposase